MRHALFLFLTLSIASSASAECRKNIALYSPKETAQQLGQSEAWVIRNYKVNVWAKKSSEGKHPKVGELLPGSHALILQESSDDYKILSPNDKSEGWISKVQVKRTLMQDSETREECK